MDANLLDNLNFHVKLIHNIQTRNILRAVKFYSFSFELIKQHVLDTNAGKQ